VAAPDLGATAIKGAPARAGVKPEAVGTAAMGNVIQAGVQMNPARQAAIAAGLPVGVPATTVNRVCGSGAQAIVSAQEILLGGVDVAVAAGMENMDLAPYLIGRGRWGYRMGDGELHDSRLRDGLNDAFSGEHSGWHTEDLAEKFRIGRETQDTTAARSQQRFSAAQAAGKFTGEIVSRAVPGRKGAVAFDKDEHNRPRTIVETIAALKPAVRPDGGRSPLAMLPGSIARCGGRACRSHLGGGAWCHARHSPRLLWHCRCGARYVRSGPDSRRSPGARALGRAGAIAHGHPIGATGAVLTTRLIHSMRRDGLRRGIVTLCIGGRQGIALALETVH
jgi:acetyl-CoA C-acetyltransferase